MKLKKTSCSISDRMDLTSRTITPQGFLVAPCVIARTGVQVYLAKELNLGTDSGIDPNTQVRLHRPAEEVFHPDSVKSFDGVPVSVNHPPGNKITAANWKDRAVGDMDDVVPENPLLAGKITVRDAGAVGDVTSGKKYLSAGYSFDLDPTPGTTADGQAYDGIMRNIRGNHIAIVDVPRGGPSCKIADSAQGGKAMRKLVVDGISFETEDSVLADAVTKLISERDTAVTKNKAKVKIGDQELGLKDPAPLQAAVDGLAKENTDLKAAQVTPEQIEKKVAARVKVIGDALKLVPDFKADGKTDVQIQREVIAGMIAKDEAAKKIVTAALDGIAVDAASPELLAIAFRLLAATPAAGSAGTRTAADSALSAALTQNNNNNGKQELTGREKYIAKLEGRDGGSSIHSHTANDCPCR